MATSPSIDQLKALRIDRNEPPPQSGLGRKVAIGVAVVAVIGVGFLGYGRLTAGVFKTEVDITSIALVSPSQGSIQLTSSGYVVPELSSKVGPRIQGRVKGVFVHEGDKVKQGDLLMTLDDAQQRSAIATAKARAAAARARASGAKASAHEVRVQLEREQKLAGSGAVAKSVVDDLSAREASLGEGVAVAEAEYKAALAEVEALTVELEHTRVLAPIDGTVVTKPLQVGETVGVSSEATLELVEIADLTSLVVETDVPEDRLDRIKRGAPAEIVLDAFAGKRFRGEVKDVRPKVNRAKATVPVKVKFVDSVEGVLPDMAAQVSFLDKPIEAGTLEAQPKVVVPKDAVAERGGGKVVFVVDEDVVHMRPVKLGPEFANGYELVDGPPAGTRIVSHPPESLGDGHKIKEKSI